MVATTNSPSPAEGFLSARFHVIPGEDPAEFDNLVRDYRRQFSPDGPAETFFFQTMILCDWKNRRVSRWEGQALRLIKPLEDGKESPVVKSLSRQFQYNERTYFRAYRELRKLQQERRKAAPSPADTKVGARPEAAKAATANAPAPSPQTGGIGFVSQKTDLPAEPQSTAPAAIPHYDLTGWKFKPGLVFVG